MMNTQAMGFPVNMPANFANQSALSSGPTQAQMANQNNPPQQTLYIRNLNQKKKAAEMRALLKKKFGEHGKVLYVQVARTQKMKGQAFVSFENVNEAMTAKDAVDGQQIDGAPVIVQFARDKSDKLSKKDETYVRRKRPRQEELDVDPITQSMVPAPTILSTENPNAMNMYPAGPTPSVTEEEEAEPHHILFVQNLPPEEAEEDANSVEELFQQFGGFVETRMVPGKNGMAFVEFATVEDANVALKALRGFKVHDNVLRLSYAKK